MSDWTKREISPKQEIFLQKLIAEKNLDGLSEEVLEQLADFESGETLSAGAASRLIDKLMAAPKNWKKVGPPKDPRPQRLVALAEAKVEAVATVEKSNELLAVVGGKTASEVGLCMACKHAPHGTGKCGQGEWMHLGYDSDYYIECTCEKDEGLTTQAMVDAGRAHAKAASADARAYRLEMEAETIERGNHVVVARGRKFPIGGKGQVLTVKDGQYGLRALVLGPEGEKFWIAASNLDHDKAYYAGVTV